MNYIITETLPERDYELLDSGDGEKLERFGKYVTARPDPQALWPKRDLDLWKRASAVFGRNGGTSLTSDRAGEQRAKGADKGEWALKTKLDERWKATIGEITFWVRLSSFKHVGVFPEHEPSWAWMMKTISEAKRPIKVLNLFGYTGGASLAAAKAGAEVVHVDASKVAIKAARENAEVSGLAEKPIRWILEDAATFVERELRRGNKYDAIIMDPPAFGHGANGEIWKIEDHLIPLVKNCAAILNEQPLFMLMNGYASGYSALAYKQIMESCLNRGGSTEVGELTIKESGSNPRNLPAGIFARWTPSYEL